MTFKPGDLVVGKKGGNKMRVISYDSVNRKIECAWFSETYNESIFLESEVYTMNQWNNVLKGEKRRETLRNLLENY